MRRAFLLLMIVLNATIVANADAAPESSIQERLERLEQELTRSRTELEEIKEQGQSALLARTEIRKQLADRLLDVALATHEGQAQHQKLRAELADEKRNASRYLQELDSIHASASNLAGVLEILCAELPARRDAETVARGWSDSAVDPAASLAELPRLLSLFDTVHDSAYRVRVSKVDLRTAGGARERVRLLAVGHVVFAYLTDGGSVAIALASPADARGFRWNDELPDSVSAQIKQAIEDVESGASSFDLPMDVSGELRAETQLATASFEERLSSGGLIMIPLLAVALLAGILILERAWFLHRQGRRGNRLLATVVAAAREGQYARAEETCQQAPGVVARTLGACLARRERGQQAMEDSIQEQLLHELPSLQRFLGGIGTLGSVAPLLGLLGTVTGIIRTFGVIQLQGNSNPELMAGGISEALVTTAAGLVIALPILLLNSFLRGRVDRVVADAEKGAATLLNTLTELDAPGGDLGGGTDSSPRPISKGGAK